MIARRVAVLRLARYRPRVIRIVVLLALLGPAAAVAQTTVNPGALDRLQPSGPAARSPAIKPAAKPASATKAAPAHRPPASKAEPAHRNAPAPRATKLRPGPPPAVPRTPPPAVVLPPVTTEPVHPVPPPPPVPIIPGAEGVASPITGGVRITFGAGKAELNPVTEAAIRNLGASVKGNPAADLNLYAFAAGVPDDPSTPRRLSLSRALAVRAVLISEGIASTRIYPRALGASASPLGPDGPADRVDIVLAGTPMPAATP